MNSLNPGLSIIHSNHLEDLRQVAVAWIKGHPLDVLDTEQIIVQSNGMAQWLKLALADDNGCGISAALEVQLPGRYVWKAYRAVLGNHIPENSPYDRERIRWRLFRLLTRIKDEPLFLPLSRFLENDPDQRRLGQLSERLADLYDQYQVYRADWLSDWHENQNCLARIGGQPVDLLPDQMWQAELWRRIRADIPEKERDLSRSDLHQQFMQQAMALGGQRPDDLSPRVTVFGISSLPRQVIETLHALSSCCQVLLFVLNPCRHFWADIIDDRDLLRFTHARHARKEGMPIPLAPEFVHQHANPLLAAWGKQGRDYIGLLYGYDAPDAYEQEFAQIDLFEDFVKDDGAQLLSQVQQAVLDLTPLPRASALPHDPPLDPDAGCNGPCSDDHRPVVAVDDLSIKFCAAHSRQREVEILQDQLLDYFDTLEDLAPGQVMVMAADIEAYAPHIEAVFGNMPFQDARFIPFTIADKVDRESVPLISALETLFYLPDSRMGVSEIFDLLGVPAFRAGFDLAQADIERLSSWVKGAGICWGLSCEQRETFGMPRGLDQNTWGFGLDRMLLGYAAGDGPAWKGIEPFDEVGGLDAALVGPLCDLVRELEGLRTMLSAPACPESWCTRIRNMVSTCFKAVDDRDLLTFSRLDDLLDQWLDDCTQAELEADICLTVVREMVMDKLRAGGMSQRFLAGKVNFGTLMPMRAIPFRVVCLLGMNDGEFPRTRPPLDFDLMAGAGMYRPGDRSRREDDRYLFLEALLSARDRLYVSYVGRDIRDNTERMPSVLVGQFQDYLGAGWQLDGDPDGLVKHLTGVHPLQPFGRGYFTGDKDGHPGTGSLFTFAREWRSVLDFSPPQSTGDPRFALPAYVLEKGPGLADLTRFLKNPVNYFFNRRLSIFLEADTPAEQDLEPFSLDGLSEFTLKDTLLAAGLAAVGQDPDAAVTCAAKKMTRTGRLPMAGFGQIAATDLAGPVKAMIGFHAALADRWPGACDPRELCLSFDNGLPEPVRLEDWLDQLHCAGPDGRCDGESRQIGTACYGRWQFYPKMLMDKNGRCGRPDTLIGLWVRHLAGSACGIDLESVMVAPDGVTPLPPMAKDKARQVLNDLVQLWYQGLCRPLPVAPKTAMAYVNTLMSKDETAAQTAAVKAYGGDGFHSLGELGYNAYLVRAYPDFDRLWTAFDNEFVRLCKVLYAPLARAVMDSK